MLGGALVNMKDSDKLFAALAALAFAKPDAKVESLRIEKFQVGLNVVISLWGLLVVLTDCAHMI